MTKQLMGVELKRFLRAYRKQNRLERTVSLFLHSVSYPYNVANIFRMAEGAGVSELVLSGITPMPPHPTITKIGRAKDRKVRWRYAPQPVDSLQELKKAGYRLIALEVTDNAQPYHRYSYPEMVCLVAGNEDHGVTRNVLACCDDAVFVPMYGTGRSHNVATAVAIATYHVIHATYQ